MTSECMGNLMRGLFDKLIELTDNNEKRIQQYEFEFRRVIERVCRGKKWDEVTSCRILEHLRKHRNPSETVIAILKGVKGW